MNSLLEGGIDQSEFQPVGNFGGGILLCRQSANCSPVRHVVGPCKLRVDGP
jgi:hypothetical protein